MGQKTNTGEMSEQQFNQAVIEELRSRGQDAAAEMSKRFDNDSRSLSSSTMADHLSESRTSAFVSEVADARIEWYEEHEA